MGFQKNTDNHPSHFYLNKWFLDFVDDNGNAMIFYSAEFKWHGLKIPYSSWLNCDKDGSVTQKSRFRNVQLPAKNEDIISWKDSKFGVSGVWRRSALPISARIFESDDGFLDWKCYQPASQTELKVGGIVKLGKGYAEQLVLTIPVWKIPMDELRWGHVRSENYQIVWIELIENETKQWLWLNGERIYNCKIDDHLILIPDKNISINLDQGVVLESEKKIMSVVEKLMNYVPGLKKHIPLKFLLADERKWLSKAIISSEKNWIENGITIHEYVNFKPLEE